MGQSTAIRFGEEELSALNARAEVLALRGAIDWEDVVDWGVSDRRDPYVPEWRMATSPDSE